MLWRRIHAAYGSTGTLDKTREPVLASVVVRRACGDLASVPDTASALMWAFEWHDPKQDLVLKRGEPWFYVRFETEDPSRPVKLVEAERTPEVKEYLGGLSAVANYVNRTFSLFSTARERRPKTLLTPKRR